mgnify:CR=1 FL=1
MTVILRHALLFAHIKQHIMCLDIENYILTINSSFLTKLVASMNIKQTCTLFSIAFLIAVATCAGTLRLYICFYS